MTTQQQKEFEDILKNKPKRGSQKVGGSTYYRDYIVIEAMKAAVNLYLDKAAEQAKGEIYYLGISLRDGSHKYEYRVNKDSILKLKIE